MTGPSDLPGRRESGDDAIITYTSGFDVALHTLIPNEVERFYFKRDAIEFRLNRARELQEVIPGQGYLITEPHLANVPECLIWFTASESADGRPLYTVDSVQLRQPPYEEEDDT